MAQHSMAGWMSMPKGTLNCPPGLEYLTVLNQLLVQRKINTLGEEIIFGIEKLYTIMNSLGQKIYDAVEFIPCCPIRPVNLKILNNYRQEVMHLTRLACVQGICSPCCLQIMEVSAPPGVLLGTIQQNLSMYPSFTIQEPAGNGVLRIQGPCCTTVCCRGREFKVMSADGRQQVGRIFREFTGVKKELFTNASYFEITFPMDLDVKMKAAVLAACFFIDDMFYGS